ncbi:ATP-binding protein [Streptomyces sp. NBC_01525]|uniref:ATP-binding protein n=1 Tax=Streptomyces sp. NBC_01525 TaxID=2903893 RepID=UPI00386EAEE2
MRELRIDVAAVPEAVLAVRRVIRRELGPGGFDVELCVGELLSNAVRHVGGGVPLSVRIAATASGGCRIAVTDPARRALPVLRYVAGDAESGRGLALVNAVAVRWGVWQHADGKTVWCETAATVRQAPVTPGRQAPVRGAPRPGAAHSAAGAVRAGGGDGAW